MKITHHLCIGAALALAFGTFACASQPKAPPAQDPASLSRAEATACAGVSDEDRDAGPFGRRDLISGVEHIETRGAKGPPSIVGATVYVRATQTMTPQWLTRIIECHRAHTAVAAAANVERAAEDPLLGAADVTVGQTADGFSVSIRTDDPRLGREIYGRARALADAPVLTSAPTP